MAVVVLRARKCEGSMAWVQVAEPLACIVHSDNAYRIGRSLVKKLKELIPRQQFKVPIQAAVGSRVIAAESISGMQRKKFVDLMMMNHDAALPSYLLCFNAMLYLDQAMTT